MCNCQRIHWNAPASSVISFCKAFYKRRNLAKVVNGMNPIEAHEYLDALKNVDSEAFRKAYQEQKEKYRLPVVEK